MWQSWELEKVWGKKGGANKCEVYKQPTGVCAVKGGLLLQGKGGAKFRLVHQKGHNQGREECKLGAQKKRVPRRGGGRKTFIKHTRGGKGTRKKGEGGSCSACRGRVAPRPKKKGDIGGGTPPRQKKGDKVPKKHLMSMPENGGGKSKKKGSLWKKRS